MDNRIPASTQLRDTATQQENTLEAVNTFKPTSNEYSANNTEVLNFSNGSTDDIKTRTSDLSINYYGVNNQYKSPE
jgi:hypothetical protein